MKRRSRFGRHHSSSPRRKALPIFGGARRRKRAGFSFERLEDRFCFSASPVELQTGSLSNDTPEGAAAIWLRELQWATTQAASAAGIENPNILYALPNDPFFPNQWHLLNTGQEVGNPDFQRLFGVAGEDIDVVPVWNKGYTGEGVVIAVIDNGTQLFHPDIDDNLHPTLRYNAITGTNNPNPQLLDFAPYHGTAVAALIAGEWNNLGDPILDINGDPILDADGNPVRTGGGTGVAPGATIVPIKLISLITPPTNPDSFIDAFQFAADQIDITNNSWGPGAARTAIPLSPEEFSTLRDTVNNGRNGLGTIHVFAAGNSAGPGFNEGFEGFGQLDSSAYNGWVNSRYVIGVTGVDHDGKYVNSDGTFTSYAETGPSVLVAAPTGSNVAQNVANDTGQGSGLWTADLVGDFGANQAELPGGFDPDRDFAPDPDYTSRFNGTSAAAPLVSGVIALMLEANPNLTYRDVQEILVRSARQNAQFETPASGFLAGAKNTWITNQIGVFRNPDPWVDAFTTPPFQSVYTPLADPNIGGGRLFGHFESTPPEFTNGAGYTVSQGYGVYSEQTGFAHGVVDADLAVKMAEQWHVLDQNSSPRTERTFTSFVFSTNLFFFAAEKMDNDNGALLVPGGIGTSPDGWIEYWDEYFADDDPADPDDGPFSDYDGPLEGARGQSFIPFTVPDDQAMSIETVEIKLSINGPTADLDKLRFMLKSPGGMQSDLNHYYEDGDHIPYSIQLDTFGSSLSGDGTLDPDGGNFVWTFTTNRSWGERSSSEAIIDPVTGEPLLQKDFAGNPVGTFNRDWELYFENWSNSDFFIQGIEVVWHGKPLQEGTKRIQGFVGVDTNADEDFNYSRHIQSVFDSDGDPLSIRLGDVQRQIDLSQEPFAENIVVSAHRVVGGVVEDNPVARFLTGADGNYYFDLVPDEYVIRVSDPLERVVLEDADTPAQYLQHYKQEWHITPDWFIAPDREPPSQSGEIGEILFDPLTQAPVPFEIVSQFGSQTVPMDVKHVNFLLKQDAPPNTIVVSGSVFADLNANGQFDGDDSQAGGVTVYWDANRDGAYNASEMTAVTSDDPLTRGQYTLTIPASAKGTYAVGVVAPTELWTPTNPADAVQDVFATPGDVIDDVNFFLDPPNEAFPPAGSDEPGAILGVVFSDTNQNRVRDPGEAGVPGFRIYIDANENGVFDAGEQQTITSSNGSYFFAEVLPGLARIEIEILNEGTDEAAWNLTSPTLGYHERQLGPGGVVSGVFFGIDNRADSDWGDLPSSYITHSGDSALGGPSHLITPGFHLGSRNDGEVNGIPTPNADGDDQIGNDDDGVVILTNNGSLRLGSNTLQVTVNGVGGYLNAWMDLNGDGAFGPGEQVLTDLDLNPGVRQVLVNIPQGTTAGPLAARFRWGEGGLSFDGPAGIGEVEDYFLPSSVVASVVLAGDYDLNGTVNNFDYDVWRATFGTGDLRGDGNGDGAVDLSDYLVWKMNFGATSGTGSAIFTGPQAPRPVAPNVLSYGFLDTPALQQWLQESGMLAHLQANGNLKQVVNHHQLPSRSTNTGAGVTSGGGSATGGAADNGTASSPFLTEALLAGLPVDVASDSSGSFSVSTLPGSNAVEAATNSASLLLVDAALADLEDDATGDADDEVWTNVCDEENVSELALAAVLEDDLWATL